MRHRESASAAPSPAAEGGIGLVGDSRGLVKEYEDFLVKLAPKLSGARVVLDCANGATYRVAPSVFAQTGAEVLTLFDTPDGANINAGSGATQPEALQRAVVDRKADIGFAFDGDGDRVISVDARGEVHDGDVDAYDGGYAAYVLARAERMRLAAGTEARRRNLMRKELAWLRRGPPARTSKPKFRIQAANELIANEPPPRDSLVLQRFATRRLGKDVFDLHRVRLEVADRVILDRVDWSIGPGARFGLVGVNGTGKTSVLRLLDGELHPAAGTVKRGTTLRIGHLSQALAEVDGTDRVLDAVESRRRVTQLAGGGEISADTLLKDFGFTGDKLTARVADLSGGERRRLQFLRLLLDEPNVLLLDEPTNDLDIDTLTVIEDYLDGWPGTLIVVTHDRYFLERVCDLTYALTGDGRCDLLPGGIEQYLADRAAASPDGPARPEPSRGESASARERRAGKEMARIEGQLAKLDEQITGAHESMADAASDHVRLGELNTELNKLLARKESLEEAWLAAAED